MVRRETVYAITSLTAARPAPAELAAGWIRGHWRSRTASLDPRRHYDEDRSQVRTGSGPQVMATLRIL